MRTMYKSLQMQNSCTVGLVLLAKMMCLIRKNNVTDPQFAITKTVYETSCPIKIEQFDQHVPTVVRVDPVGQAVQGVLEDL